MDVGSVGLLAAGRLLVLTSRHNDPCECLWSGVVAEGREAGSKTSVNRVDHVFHLGDISRRGTRDATERLARLRRRLESVEQCRGHGTETQGPDEQRIDWISRPWGTTPTTMLDPSPLRSYILYTCCPACGTGQILGLGDSVRVPSISCVGEDLLEVRPRVGEEARLVVSLRSTCWSIKARSLQCEGVVSSWFAGDRRRDGP